MTTLKPDAFEEVSGLLRSVERQPSPFCFSQIFLKLEEESERRALEAEGAAHSPNIPDLAMVAEQAAQQRQRSRGSISISRFGHVSPSHFFLSRTSDARPKIEDDTQQQTTLRPSSQIRPPALVHRMTTFSPFYAAQSHVCLSLAGYACSEPMRWADRGFVAQNPSADSLSDQSFFGDDGGLSAESEHVTQVHRIAGRQSLPRSVGGMLQRTLTRSWTSSGLSSSGINTNVVVGVVVEEDHVEEPEPREGLPRQSMVYAQAPTLRPQPSRMTIPGAQKRDANGSWRSRAGELFRRKARPRNTLWSTPRQES